MNDNEYMQRVRSMDARLYRIAQAILWRPPDCADAVQEAVFHGWLKKESLKDAHLFETWLVRILINECRDQLKRRSREDRPVLLEGAAQEHMCEDLHLREALKKLPEKYRLPLVLHHMEGYSIGEVASMLGLAPSRVTSRLHMARKNLRCLLDGGAEE